MTVWFVAVRQMGRALVFTVASATPLMAQVARGIVRSAADSSPLVGAIVQLRDSAGAIVRSSLTNRSGAFTIAARTPGVYSLHVLRIGYRPFDSGRIVVDASARALSIFWSAPPIVLASQRVSGARTCRLAADSGTMVVRVWEEARKALLASLLADEQGMLDITRLNLSRTLDSSGRVVRRQRVVSERAQSFHAYASLAPDTLAARGYVRDDPSGVSFYAPDALALLADSFIGMHCFSVRDGIREHAGEVGLSFEPHDLLDGRVDIRGTFWIERRSWQLRQLSFAYEGLPAPAANALNGGFVDFGALADGAWIVSNWRLRLPRLASRQRITDGGARRVTLSPTSREVVAIEEVGGVVVSARRDGKMLLQAELPSLDVVIVAASTTVPYGVATVALDGTGLTADADSAGRVHFSSLVEGRYELSVRFALLDAVGLPPLRRTVDLRAGTRTDSVNAPSADEVLRRACGVEAVQNQSAVIFGTLRDSIDQPSAGVVYVTWPASAKVITSRKRDDQLSWVEQMRGVLVGADGRYKLCGVPRQGLVIRAEGLPGVAARFTRLYEAEPLRSLDLQLAHGAQVARDEAAGAPTLAYLELRVVRNDGGAAAGVSLEIVDANGHRTRTRTDDAGRALLVSQPVGVTRVRTRSEGDHGVIVETSLSVGRNVLVITLTER